METPDKIFQCRFAAGEYDVIYRVTPEPYAENTEYIRKDALMEWLNTRVNDYGHTTPFRLAIQSVIDKLNSL